MKQRHIPLPTRSESAIEAVLTPAQVASIRQTFSDGSADNTQRAYKADLRHFWAWARTDPDYPVSPGRLLAYLADHSGQLAVSTLDRRVAAMSTAHRMLGFGPTDNPSHHPQIRSYMSALRRQVAKAGKSPRKKKAAPLDVLQAMLNTCTGESLADIRDAAVLALGFASGGRRRSELATINVDDVEQVPGGYLIHLRRSKTDQQGHGMVVPCRGGCADYLRAWIAAAEITSGPLFRALTRHGRLRGSATNLSPHAIGQIVKRRASLAGYDPAAFGGHSLRSGFVTEAGRQGIPTGDAMALSGHRSLRVFQGYYQAGAVMDNRAGCLLDTARESKLSQGSQHLAGGPAESKP